MDLKDFDPANRVGMDAGARDGDEAGLGPEMAELEMIGAEELRPRDPSEGGSE